MKLKAGRRLPGAFFLSREKRKDCTARYTSCRDWLLFRSIFSPAIHDLQSMLLEAAFFVRVDLGKACSRLSVSGLEQACLGTKTNLQSCESYNSCAQKRKYTGIRGVSLTNGRFLEENQGR